MLHASSHCCGLRQQLHQQKQQLMRASHQSLFLALRCRDSGDVVAQRTTRCALCPLRDPTRPELGRPLDRADHAIAGHSDGRPTGRFGAEQTHETRLAAPTSESKSAHINRYQENERNFIVAANGSDHLVAIMAPFSAGMRPYWRRVDVAGVQLRPNPAPLAIHVRKRRVVVCILFDQSVFILLIPITHRD